MVCTYVYVLRYVCTYVYINIHTYSLFVCAVSIAFHVKEVQL